MIEEAQMSDVRVVPSSDDLVVIEAAFLNFTPEQLFSHWIQPNLLQKWWPQQAEISPKVGYHFSWPTMNWHLRGEYSVYNPGNELAFSWSWDHEPDRPVRQVKITFVNQDKVSQLTLTHGTYTGSAEDREERQGHIDGWRQFLGQLQKLES
jgi:uncharacterized protein YndB with AHSA1/START domain